MTFLRISTVSQNSHNDRESQIQAVLPGAAGAAVLLVTVLSSTLFAHSFVPPLHLGDLARESDAVVLASAMESESVKRGSFFFTRTTFGVTTTVKGELLPGRTFVVEAPGGTVGEHSWVVFGSPSFVKNEQYLLCLDREQPGRSPVWRLPLLDYGVLHEVNVDDASYLLPMRDGSEGAVPRLDGRTPEPIGSYTTETLIPHLRNVTGGASEWRRLDAGVLSDSQDAQVQLKGVGPPGGRTPAVPDGCTYFEDRNRYFRWSTFDSGGSAPMWADNTGDLDMASPSTVFTLMQFALDAWNDVPDSSVDLRYGGSVNASQTCTPTNEDLIENVTIFNDPCNDIPDLNSVGQGTLALGGPFINGTHSFEDLDGRNATWVTCVGWAVLINNGVRTYHSNTIYRQILTHEFGHGLGFGHYDDPQATMFANCCNNINSQDRTCLTFTYPGIGEAVTNLACQCDGAGNLDLTWTNDPDLLGSSIDIEINGATIATIAGTATSYEIDALELILRGFIVSVAVVNGSGREARCDFSSEEDCEFDGLPDICDLNNGSLLDCNNNSVPDICDVGSGDRPDCNVNGIPDECDIDSGVSDDCDSNGTLDSCDLSQDPSLDCNSNMRPDSCDILDGTSIDADGNGRPDECGRPQLPGDCNQDGLLDIVDPLCLLWVLFAGGVQDPPCEPTLDSPGNTALLDWQPDAQVDVTDAVSVLLFIFAEGASHTLSAAGNPGDCLPIFGCPALFACD